MIVGVDATNLRAGGGLTHVVGLLDGVVLPAHGVDRVVVWAGRATLDAIRPRKDVELRHAPAADGALARRLWWQRVGLATAARGTCDLLFIPGGAGTEGFRPRVVMSRNLLPFEFSEALRFGLSPVFVRLMALRWAQRRAFAEADGVIFLSEYAHETVRARIPRAPAAAAVIPHGVSEEFRKAPRRQKLIHEYNLSRPFRLLYVSTIGPYKHQVKVAQAIAMLRAEGWPVVMDFVGGHDTPAALARFTRAIHALDPTQDFLRYGGREAHGGLPARYHQADTFVFASSCENMPNTLVEAMAAGLPIACSDRGPMPEVLTDAGAYFDPENAASIHRAVRGLIADPALRARFAALAYARATAYTWARCADATFSFLAQVGGAR